MKLFCIIYSNLRTNLVPLKAGTGFLAIQSKISLYSLAKIYIYKFRLIFITQQCF